MTTLAPGGTANPPASSRRTLLMVLCAVAIVAVSVDSGVEAALGGNKLLLIIPLGGFAGIGLAALGLVNFENFVLFTIALRASLDITKPSSGNTGAAGVSSASSTSALDPAGALAILFILMAFFWFLTRHREGRRSPPASIHRICLFIFCAAGFLSVIDSTDVLFSVTSALKVGAVVAMLAVLEVMLVDRAAIQRMIAAIYLSAVVPVGYTLILIVTHHSQFTSGGFARFEGTFSQPNPFAIYLTMLIVMGVAIFPHLSRRNKFLMSALLFGCVIALYSTFTRSAWLAAIAAVILVAVLGRRRLLIGGLVIGAVVALAAVPTIAERFADLGASTSPNGYATNSLVWRFDYWDEVIPLAARDPVTGIGLGMSSFETVQAKEPHNDPLRAYVETGIVGLLAYFLLLTSMGLVARQSMRYTKRRPRSYERSIAIGFVACVIAFVVLSLVSNVITQVVVLWYYVAFAAAAYAVTRYRENAVLRGLPPPAEEAEVTPA
ncbi:MAG: O-antigen ligase family protein [Candidatus Dormibacteria bacterium]